ncbi:MAG TPA: hypothetical protein VGG43_06185 [Acidimicrobiales bacterium]|jgi:hypothetical protein
MSMHPPMMDKLASGHIDDLRRTADRYHRESRVRAHRHPGTAIARVIGVSLIRIGGRLAGPDSRTEPRILSAREAEFHTLT